MIFKLYAQPLGAVVLEILLGTLLWAVLSAMLGRKKPKLWRVLNSCLLAVSVFAVLFMTVLRRTSGAHELILIPGYFLQEGKRQPEIYRSLLMNVLLFTPLGLSLSAVLSKNNSTWRCIGTVTLISLGFSVLVEATQFIGCLGRAEVDDVLANTLGALIGALHVPIGKALQKRIRINSSAGKR